MFTVREIRPQPGPQTQFLTSPADIIIYGGSAGGGKSWSILLEVLRGVVNPNFNAVIFRRTFPQIRNPGGLWDASSQIFPLVGARPRETKLEWAFPSGACCVFRHLKLESNVYDWQGAEVVYIGFDELTHFSESQFWYMLSRNRSTCGIRPFVRATCNPDSESWVRQLIDWWIGPDGLPIPERSGVVRHFIRENGAIVWVSPDHPDAKNLTFIAASIFDNKALLEKDPDYLKNLKSLPLVERERLLGGNWDIKPSAGKVFRADWFPVLDVCPPIRQACRYWDFASTAEELQGNNPDYTTGAKLAELLQPIVVGERLVRFVLLDVKRARETPAGVDRLLQNSALQDGRQVSQRWQRDPGQAGVYQDQKLRSLLSGHDAMGVIRQVSKHEAAKPLSRACEFGEVALLRGDWNQAFLNELSLFPDGDHDDQVDAAAGAYNVLTRSAVAQSSSTGKYR